MTLEIKATTAQQVISASGRTTIPGIAGLAAEICPQIAADVERRGLTPAGPWVFVYHHLPQDATTSFTADFCLPVAMGTTDYRGVYACRTLAPLHCASRLYEGDLAGLFSAGYAPLMGAIAASGHRFSGESREVYHRWQGPAAGANRIEIQIGLAVG